MPEKKPASKFVRVSEYFMDYISKISPNAVVVYLYLRSGPEGYRELGKEGMKRKVSNGELCKETSLCEKTVIKATDELAVWGFIEKRKFFDPEKNRNEINEYTIYDRIDPKSVEEKEKLLAEMKEKRIEKRTLKN